MSAGFYWTLCGLYDEYKSVHTPESHEDGEEDSGWVVKQVASSSCTTRCHQLPVAAGVVAQRTHGDVVPRITNFHTGKTGTDGRIIQRGVRGSKDGADQFRFRLRGKKQKHVGT